MKYILKRFITLFNSFFFVFSIIQDWNLKNSSIDLFSSSDSLTVIVKE